MLRSSFNRQRCARISDDLENLSVEEKYRILEALSHPTRVRILKVVGEKEKGLSFLTLKHELGLESSGQLQHHLHKLSGFIIVEKDSGHYGLADIGRRALNVYKSSERSGKTLEATCCLPVRLDAPKPRRVGRTGSTLRLSAAAILLVLTVALIGSGQAALRLNGSSISIGFGLSGAIFAGFSVASFLIAGLKGYPGCEIMAIPNLLAGKTKYYCSCVITPFNLPNGRLLEPLEPSGRNGEKLQT